ncbi:hypothetical protein BDZ85DRAFT_120460 [Elsinoe ampelina]|uniref:Zn(2)-C6 fungal-type domain-containing protein n=1 Tax=Elsinoe ampelina TaxID=302913 RepID=A0A6A6GBC4_9PEZI|nr:hypothetical protein BDZ85DRAFT_120460 [Elsinoe ampelina]
MPGVPTSKSCDACLKSKRKCDRQPPACSRCARLKIPCINAGVRRYRFFAIEGRRKDGATMLVVKPPSRVTLVAAPQGNATTRLAGRLVTQLGVSNVRYNIRMTYGPLLSDIPRRLGENAVLDAATVALVATFDDLACGQMSQQRFRAYGEALSELRQAVQNPAMAHSPLTLCAILLIWICQGWIGGDQSNAQGHGAGFLRLISRTSLRHSRDPFELTLLHTILASTIFEAAFDPDLELEPWVSDFMLAGGKKDDISVMSCLLQLSSFLKYDYEVLPQLRRYYHAMKQKCITMRDLLGNMSHPGVSEQAQIVAASSVSAFGLTSGVALALNGIARAYDPDDPQLVDDSDRLHRDIVGLANRARAWLPLAGGWIPIAPEFAWLANSDPVRQREIEETWNRCWKEVSHSPFGVSSRFKQRFDQLRASAAINYQYGQDIEIYHTGMIAAT